MLQILYTNWRFLAEVKMSGHPMDTMCIPCGLHHILLDLDHRKQRVVVRLLLEILEPIPSLLGVRSDDLQETLEVVSIAILHERIQVVGRCGGGRHAVVMVIVVVMAVVVKIDVMHFLLIKKCIQIFIFSKVHSAFLCFAAFFMPGRK